MILSPSVFGIEDFYWENPEPFSSGAGSFPQTAAGGDIAACAWQEAIPSSSTAGQIYISIAINDSQNENGWTAKERIAGPYPYSMREPSIFTLSIDRLGRIFICIAVTPSQTDILLSEDRGKTFSRYTLNQTQGGQNSLTNGQATTDTTALVPRIFHTADGSSVLFVVRTVGQNMTLYYAHSLDGRNWSGFQQFVNSAGLSLNFLPTHASLNGVDYVVFQSFIPGTINRPSFQLYMKQSYDGGRTWSSEKRLSIWQDTISDSTANADAFNNERPHLSLYGNGLFMVWERRYGAGVQAIYGAQLNTNGEAIRKIERISAANANCQDPKAFSYRGENMVVWFDNRRGGKDGAYIAQFDGTTWQNIELSRYSDTAIFTRAAIAEGHIYIFWQEAVDGKNRIFTLLPDTTGTVPRLVAENFTDGKRTSNVRAEIAWNVPYDSSGIVGFSWSWSRDPNAEPVDIVAAGVRTTSAREFADEDGAWYFSLKSIDNAGNWSDTARLTFIRDITAPKPVKIFPPENDDGGFVLSNSFSVGWEPPNDADVAGYSWNLDYLGALNATQDAVERTVSLLDNRSNAMRIMGSQPKVSYNNEDNGIWRFSVSPIDDVGNVGEAASFILRLNKYVPHTFITLLNGKQDIQGNLDLEIIGRGFSENGLVQRIFFRRDGEIENIRILTLSENQFVVRSDRNIMIRDVENLPEGKYYITVEHPLRGRAAGSTAISVLRSLTVKFGDHTNLWHAEWLVRLSRRFILEPTALILGLIMVFCMILALFTLRGVVLTFREGRAIQIETMAIINGELMPSEKKQRITVLRKHGIGVRVKIAGFTLALVSVVVLMVSMPLYIMMSNTQRETMMQSLWDRSVVLLEGITASARVFMPSNNVLELGYLPSQSAAVPEALYVTITGFGSGNTVTNDYVWATNDINILDKINTQILEAGVSRLKDSLTTELQSSFIDMNIKANQVIAEMAESIADLNREGSALALLTDQRSVARLEDIQVTTRALESRISEILNGLSEEVLSYPPFSTNDYETTGNTEYILYKPILFRQSSSDIYARGAVRLAISSESIIEEMLKGRRQILNVLMIIALMALLIGGIGAWIVSTLIVIPIKKLVTHVEKIRDTDDKSTLAGIDVEIKTRDELFTLGETINEMTRGIVKAYIASQDLSIGKEIQKKFIPLDIDKDGNKLTSGFKNTKNLRFFGYYEGAKGVSGDYFDYQAIDDRYFAIIKCDVAGKGVPAALIMTQVATMFINYFKTWKPTEDGMKIETLVYQINDFIEALAFKGRFAAFTLCIFDSETGVVRFCNAGDNLIHWFDRSEGRLKYLTLPQTPATGVLPNFMVEAAGGYKVQTMTIDHGDILLLYTDGIEEAKRKFRDYNFNEIICQEGGAGNDTPHGNHVVGQADEEMGVERVEEIINAVMNRQLYTLYKYHNPLGEIEYHFDFTNCKGTVEEVIMGMVSVEKVFRMYKNPNAGEDSRVLVDSKVNSFLKEHFTEYHKFLQNTENNPENPMYIYYTHIEEDEQYDDLTILGVNRK
ncbi:hypothetical protein AGMMS50212_01790 [Spirochaetia bacterium]|nr:hypothetical protein AGMMS50212_01790 [Spirochaetia bacterium]